MTTAQDWDGVFKARQWGRWPDTRAVEWVMRRFGKTPRDERGAIKILEIGYGAGAQLAFLLDEGFTVHGVESSEAACRQADERLAHFWPDERQRLNTWNTVAQSGAWGFDGANEYDAVLDICTLQHLAPVDSKETMRLVLSRLKPGGAIFSKWRHSSAPPLAADMPPCWTLTGGSVGYMFEGLAVRYGWEEFQPWGVAPGSSEPTRHLLIEGEKVHVGKIMG